MIKWFVYIVFMLVFMPCILTAKVKKSRRETLLLTPLTERTDATETTLADTTIKVLKSSNRPDGKVKEVAKAKRQPKPEKVEPDPAKAKPKRQRRPDGMERPPEIPRRNDN